MEFAAMTVFFAALALILILFTVKKIEVRRQQRFGENLRQLADAGALRVKASLMTTERYIESLPFFISAIARYGVHIGALSFARLARTLESEAHRLADMVSHKRGFERKETKSKYLKEVSSYKNTPDSGVASE
jgi:hypothetical protein